MLLIKRTDSGDADFLGLVAQLDQDLAIRDGDEHAFYAQFNKVAQLPYCMVGYFEYAPVACGALRALDEQTMELKRMFVHPEHRRQGYASQMLAELERQAAALGYHRCVLETGKKQPEAIALYLKSGYRFIPNYGQDAGGGNSVCMEKLILAEKNRIPD
ncbi:MAG: GNAT family N-acetyltransferase [Saprospiraceae bacterium]|nr:GNAT family N-acetyltransferase [Saprospiraceae bacterium]